MFLPTHAPFNTIAAVEKKTEISDWSLENANLHQIQQNTLAKLLGPTSKTFFDFNKHSSTPKTWKNFQQFLEKIKFCHECTSKSALALDSLYKSL